MATPQSKADISPPTSELSSTGPSEKPSDQDNRDSEERVFPTGWRLHLLTFALVMLKPSPVNTGDYHRQYGTGLDCERTQTF